MAVLEATAIWLKEAKPAECAHLGRSNVRLEVLILLLEF
ncbi:MAG: hypothetical protein JWM68_1703 [Verrucomicrobiales bacterium]|nr:hypothetical protein [Verrucomicrobiales bacterium]